MKNFEGADNFNNVVMNQFEGQAITSVDVKPEETFALETLKNSNVEEMPQQVLEKRELSIVEQLRNTESNIATKEQDIFRLQTSIQETRNSLSLVRERLGLQPLEEEPLDILSKKEKLDMLNSEYTELKHQEEELITQQEKEDLIQKKIEQLLQEKINQFFEELEVLSEPEFMSILNTGMTLQGSPFESKTFGILESGVLRSLAEAFQEGVNVLSDIFQINPEISEDLKENVHEEAAQLVEVEIVEEQEKIEHKEESPEVIEDDSKVIEVEAEDVTDKPVAPNPTPLNIENNISENAA